MKPVMLAIFILTSSLGGVPFTSAQTPDQLVAGAKKEGRLVLYASAAVQQLQMYFAAFNNVTRSSRPNIIAPTSRNS